ncbi:M61 family metallopeptidase [Mucilaginibacter paludis]|uniref:Peptidase M61 domain protein n=1 Tax=Mucilaginibacter paludis DSM 18603 TaxID=714943 RepID=H1Y8S5_9SPHI|nr:PDZ domain-containing protein [Mucilaginibacter paludis]EHQ26947.1 peptidase M61 domain protein [Mucilaginibacter paludis DSM 18603]
MKKIFSCIFYIILLIKMDLNASAAIMQSKINYTVTFPEAQAHYTHIEMTITGLTQGFVDVKMPVWTPGSYLVREFAKNVEGFVAEANGEKVAASKTSKNTWHIESGSASSVKISYDVYCFEVSVRTSLVDASQGFLSTSGMFMYPDGMLHEPSTLHIIPYQGWKTVSTSLEAVGGDPFTLYSPDYDTLFDSPIQVGNQDVFDFDAAGVKYEVAMCGGGNYDKGRLKKDITKIVEQETAIYNDNPNKRYVIIVHNYAKGGGGLEHLSSTVLGATRDGYTNEATYHNFLVLVAHEHFHLWNVKRLRPFALGPFDYEKENYTTNLWIAEGFTTYYQSLIMRRANLYALDDHLKIVADNLSGIDNQPGSKIQPVSEGSFDAWIKFYRPNENSANTTISYYNKGAAIAMLLDLEIIYASKATMCLDDVMKYMYDEYYKAKKRGYTDAEFKIALEKFTGKNLDDFYKKHINGVDVIDYDNYLNYAGYKLVNTLANRNDAFLGISLAPITGRNIIASISRNSPAWVAGVSANDELLAIDGASVSDLDKYLAKKKPGDQIELNLNRDGIEIKLSITLSKNEQVKYSISDTGKASAEQLAVRKKWLNL